MAFFQDVKGALPTIRGPRYTVTLMGGGAAVLEYRGKPLKISRECVTVEVKGAVIAVRGSDMVVTESGGGQMFVTGKVSAVEVLD